MGARRRDRRTGSASSVSCVAGAYLGAVNGCAGRRWERGRWRRRSAIWPHGARAVVCRPRRAWRRRRLGLAECPRTPNLPQAVRAIPTSLIEFLRLASASHQRFFVSARVLLVGNVASGEARTMDFFIPIVSRVARQVTDTYPSHAEHEPAHE